MSTKRWLIAAVLTAVTLSGNPGGASLVEAAKKADQQAVRTLLKNQPSDVNTPSADGTTALHWAVNRGDLDMVDILLASGANIKAANRYGVQPLSLAAESGNAAVIDRLLKAGADPNTSMPGGETVLMTAARTGNVDAIKLLLVRHADVNARDERSGQTALMWAAARGNTDAIRILVEFGGDIRARTDLASSKTGLQEVRDTLIMSPAPTSFTAFLFAVRAGHIEAAKALLELGANVNDLLSDGESALVVAAANAHWELASFLLDKGADPNLAGAGWNALHQAVRERRPNLNFGTPGPIPTGTLDSIEVIKKMIAHGVDINARMSKNGMKDGQRNRLNRLGATAFLLAAKNTDVEVMRLLLAAGADASIPAWDRTTPLMVASGLKIWNPGEDGGSLPGQEQEVLEAVKICVEQGNDVNATNDQMETPLHGAAYRGADLVVQYLVGKGAKLDAKDIRGWTPLLVANGISYSEFFKAQPPTADLLRELMKAQSLSVEGQVADGKECLDCHTVVSNLRAMVEREKKMEAEYAAQQDAASRKSSKP